MSLVDDKDDVAAFLGELGVQGAFDLGDAKILRASSSELARRSTRFHGSASPAGARNMTWYFVPPSSGA